MSTFADGGVGGTTVPTSAHCCTDAHDTSSTSVAPLPANALSPGTGSALPHTPLISWATNAARPAVEPSEYSPVRRQSPIAVHTRSGKLLDPLTPSTVLS